MRNLKDANTKTATFSDSLPAGAPSEDRCSSRPSIHALRLCIRLLPHGQIHSTHPQSVPSPESPLFRLLLLANRFPDCNARVSVVELWILNVPHHPVLVLPLHVFDEVRTGTRRLLPKIESDFPKKAASEAVLPGCARKRSQLWARGIL